MAYELQASERSARRPKVRGYNRRPRAFRVVHNRIGRRLHSLARFRPRAPRLRPNRCGGETERLPRIGNASNARFRRLGEEIQAQCRAESAQGCRQLLRRSRQRGAPRFARIAQPVRRVVGRDGTQIRRRAAGCIRASQRGSARRAREMEQSCRRNDSRDTREKSDAQNNRRFRVVEFRVAAQGFAPIRRPQCNLHFPLLRAVRFHAPARGFAGDAACVQQGYGVPVRHQALRGICRILRRKKSLRKRAADGQGVHRKNARSRRRVREKTSRQNPLVRRIRHNPPRPEAVARKLDARRNLHSQGKRHSVLRLELSEHA